MSALRLFPVIKAPAERATGTHPISAKAVQMPLSSALNNTLLTHRCPHCGHRTEKTGDWFKIVGRYQCKSCLRPVSLTYEDKVQLFEDHGHLAVPDPRSVTAHGKA